MLTPVMRQLSLLTLRSIDYYVVTYEKNICCHPSNCCTLDCSSLRVCIPICPRYTVLYTTLLRTILERGPYSSIIQVRRLRATQQSAKSEKVRKVSWRGSSLDFYNDNGQYGKWYKGTALLRRMRIYTKQQTNKIFATPHYTRFDYSVQYYYLLLFTI